MSETMLPGPDCDALIAEKVLGLKLCRDVTCEGEDCPAESSGIYLTTHNGALVWIGLPYYSTDLSVMEAAAEEARKAGRIRWWSLNSPTAADPSWDAQAGTGAFDHEFSSIGSRVSGAHALALALLTACGGAA